MKKEINSYTLKRIEELCKLAGVQWYRVSFATCPECRLRDKSNRDKELFHCICYGYTADADFVGAYNIHHKGRNNSTLLGKKPLWGVSKCL